jgi:hypothetical protein
VKAKRRTADTADPLRHDVAMRSWTVLAQDPDIKGPGGVALTTQVSIPAERLERGPKGHRVHVIDYDAAADKLYRSRTTDLTTDPYVNITSIDRLVADPYFHQQNVYAITMATLREFEGALGRPVDWGFSAPSHQIKVSPHAFADANAFYSRESESLNFGYFPDSRGKRIYTCLSHDIVVHETTHALLDGLRSAYLNPSSADQAGFHEGFADIVALLSVFRHTEVINFALAPLCDASNRVATRHLNIPDLGNTALAKLAEQMGGALDAVRGGALRQSLTITPLKTHYGSARFQEEHDRGELLVAIVIRSFISVWLARLKALVADPRSGLSRSVVAEEGATAAQQLLRIVIRALDYMPPVDMTYGDFVSALLTADLQLYPDDGRYGYRAMLREMFTAYGVLPASRTRSDGVWAPPPDDSFTMTGMHLERLQRDPSAVFRFVWENRDALGIEPDAFTRVTSVRPVIRVSNDQTVLRETVAEYLQTLQVYSGELEKKLKIRRPDGMRSNRLITLYGGGTLIFSEFGRLKFHIGTGVRSSKQSARLQSLWERGYFETKADAGLRIAQMHSDRALRPQARPREDW